MHALGDSHSHMSAEYILTKYATFDLYICYFRKLFEVWHLSGRTISVGLLRNKLRHLRSLSKLQCWYISARVLRAFARIVQ